MISLERGPWREMVNHAQAAYPNECCGAMIGTIDGDKKTVSIALALDNVHAGPQATRYELRPEDLLRADREARERKLDLIGIYHSHPDCGAYFSETDLKNSCPWYSFVILSIHSGKFDHANSWLPNAEQTEALKEELTWPRILIPTPLRQFAEKQDTVEISGGTVGEVLASLTAKFPSLKNNLFNEAGKLRSFVNVYLNDEDIRYLNKEASPVTEADTISIVPSIAGGLRG